MIHSYLIPGAEAMSLLVVLAGATRRPQSIPEMSSLFWGLEICTEHFIGLIIIELDHVLEHITAAENEI